MKQEWLEKRYEELCSNGEDAYAGQYVRLIADAYLFWKETEKSGETDTAMREDLLSFFDLLRFCDMIWCVGGDRAALRDPEAAGSVGQSDPRLLLFREIQKELQKKLTGITQGMSDLTGIDSELFNARQGLEEYFPEDENDRQTETVNISEAAEEEPERMTLSELLEEIPDAKECAFFETLEAFLELAPDGILTSTETVDGTELRDLMEDIRTEAYELGKVTLSWFMPDQNGKVRYLNTEEIGDLGNRYQELQKKLTDLAGYMRECESAETPAGVADSLSGVLDGCVQDLLLAGDCVRKYVPVPKQDHVRLFSVYELFGLFRKERNNKYLQYAQLLQEQAQELTENEEVSAVAAELWEMTEQMLPEILRRRSGGELFLPVEPELLAELEEYFLAKEYVLSEYLRNTSRHLEEIEHEELEFFKTARVVLKWIRRYTGLYGLLNGDENGERLEADITDFLYTEEPKENSAGGIQDPSLYSGEDAVWIRYAICCRQMHIHDGLLVGFLLEDPEDMHGLGILSEGYCEEIYAQSAQNITGELAGSIWDNGRRDLSGVPRYRELLNKEEDFCHIFQCATKNDWELFGKVTDRALMYLPGYLNHVDTVFSDEDTGRQSVRQIDLAKLIRQEVEQWENAGASLTEYYDVTGGVTGILYRIPGFEDFENAEDRQRVTDFLKRVEVELQNAGVGQEAQKALQDPHIPDRYNEAIARIQADVLFGNTDSGPRYRFLPPDAFTAENERTVVLALARANADPVSTDTVEFFTTVRDFRRSDFVDCFGEMREDMETVQLILTGMDEEAAEAVFSKNPSRKHFDADTEQRINEARSILSNLKKEAYPMHSESTESMLDAEILRKPESYEKGTILAGIADLQVADYLLGVPKRKPEDLRLGFAVEDGRIHLCNVRGADHPGTRPFLMCPPEEESRLFHPRDLLVMTTDMYRRLCRWREGIATAREEHFTESEREVFDCLPAGIKDGFVYRLNRLLGFVREKDEASWQQMQTKEAPVVKVGAIHVLDSEDFDKLNLEDLILGWRMPAVNEKDIIARNLFDVLLEMPQKCSDALLDKALAFLCGAEEKEFGAGLGRLGERLYREQKMKLDQMMDLQMTARLIRRTEELCEAAEAMAEENNGKENALHRLLGDAGFFQTAALAAEQMRDTIRKNCREVEEELKQTEQIRRERLDAYSAEILTFRKERLTYAVQIAERQAKKTPTELPVHALDPYLYFPSYQAMGQFRDRLREQFEKRRALLGDNGKDRYAGMLRLFNQINRGIARYASLTGDTSIMPVLAVAMTEWGFSVDFSDLYETEEEYERTIPYYYAAGRTGMGQTDTEERNGRRLSGGERSSRRLDLQALMNES